MNKQNFNLSCTVIVTTFYAGNKLDVCLNSIPHNFRIIVIDNGNELKNKNIYEKKYRNIRYLMPGENLGIPGSYNYALQFIKTKYLFQIQPDVVLKKNCINEMILAAKKYPNAAILSPIVYNDSLYEELENIRILKFNKKKKLKNLKIKKNLAFSYAPKGDLSVDAITATAMFIDVEKLRMINGWDNNIFAYYDDIDLCLRFKMLGFEIVKIKNSEVNHEGFSSHSKEFHQEMDYSRNFHYSWSKIYFLKKHSSRLKGNLEAITFSFVYLIKLLFYFITNKQKYLIYKSKFLGNFASLIGAKAYYRPKILL
jgi:N-acetylglucosaminyl-diphospho-decaprenol L-rhamnosyltransferase